MRYIVGVAFVVALLQGNIEIAVTVAFAVFLVIGIFNLVDIFRKRSSFSSFCGHLHAQLGKDWIIINLRDADCSDLAAIIFNANSKIAHLVSTKSYGSTEFKSEPIGEILSVRVEELRPTELIQPNAIIRVHCQEISRRFAVAGGENWKLLQTQFLEFNKITS